MSTGGSATAMALSVHQLAREDKCRSPGPPQDDLYAWHPKVSARLIASLDARRPPHADAPGGGARGLRLGGRQAAGLHAARRVAPHRPARGRGRHRAGHPARGVRLTDAGLALVEHADAVLIRLGAAEEE